MVTTPIISLPKSTLASAKLKNFRLGFHNVTVHAGIHVVLFRSGHGKVTPHECTRAWQELLDFLSSLINQSSAVGTESSFVCKACPGLVLTYASLSSSSLLLSAASLSTSTHASGRLLPPGYTEFR